jgi:hypothetical protein
MIQAVVAGVVNGPDHKARVIRFPTNRPHPATQGCAVIGGCLVADRKNIGSNDFGSLSSAPTKLGLYVHRICTRRGKAA